MSRREGEARTTDANGENNSVQYVTAAISALADLEASGYRLVQY